MAFFVGAFLSQALISALFVWISRKVSNTVIADIIAVLAATVVGVVVSSYGMDRRLLVLDDRTISRVVAGAIVLVLTVLIRRGRGTSARV